MAKIMRLATVQKEQRHESILLSLKKLGFLSRSQIQRLHRLGSVRNANRVLNDLAPYLNVVKLGEYVYYLNAEGRRRIGATKALTRTNQVEHHVMRNQLYIIAGCPSNWRAEVRLKVNGEVSAVADALYTVGKRYVICEIDHTQKMAQNREKIAKYRRMVELGVFKEAPQFVWLTTTEYRRREIARLCEGLNVTVYTVNDIF